MSDLILTPKDKSIRTAREEGQPAPGNHVFLNDKLDGASSYQGGMYEVASIKVEKKVNGDGNQVLDYLFRVHDLPHELRWSVVASQELHAFESNGYKKGQGVRTPPSGMSDSGRFYL